MEMQELILSSLEQVSDRLGDIAPLVYEHYYQLQPGAEDLMAHLDDIPKGKMMTEVMRLIMVEDFADEDQYLSFEMKTHAESYSVTPDMYESLLMAVHSVVKQGLGADWSDDLAVAWQSRLADVQTAVQTHLPA